MVVLVSSHGMSIIDARGGFATVSIGASAGGLAALAAFFFGIRVCIEKLVKPDSHVAKVEAAVATGRLPLDGHFSRFGRPLPSDVQDWNG
jgi:hypothetical protein